MFDFISFFPRAVAQGIPLLLGSTGETLTEKSGNLNLGIPGIMYVGAICGVIGSFFYEQHMGAGAALNPFLAIAIPLLCSLLGSCLMGLLYCFLTVTLRANQNVMGLALTTFGVGVGNFFGGSLIKLTGSEVPSIALSATSAYFSRSLPFADKCGVFGKLFLSYGFLAYVAVIIALVTSYILRRTRIGLQLRAVGESPSTADAAGINVNRYKYVATCVGSMIAGLGGLYYIMDYACGVWSNNAFGDRGWLHGLAAECGRARFDPVRRLVHPVPVAADRREFRGQGAVQDAAIHRDGDRTDRRFPAPPPREPAAGELGPAVFP